MQRSSRSVIRAVGLILLVSGLSPLPVSADIAPKWSDAELVGFLLELVAGLADLELGLWESAGNAGRGEALAGRLDGLGTMHLGHEWGAIGG